MRITLRKKNLEITPALQKYIEKKIIAPVKKLLAGLSFPALPILDIEIARTTRHHRKGKVFYAEANLTLNGIALRGEAEAQDIHAACDILENELRREISSYKDKSRAKEKRAGQLLKRKIQKEEML